jgi:hypothetical protein
MTNGQSVGLVRKEDISRQNAELKAKERKKKGKEKKEKKKKLGRPPGSGGKAHAQARAREKDQNMVECGSWDESERKKLLKLVAKLGTGHWDKIAEKIGARSIHGCRYAYYTTVVPRPKMFPSPRPEHPERDEKRQRTDGASGEAAASGSAADVQYFRQFKDKQAALSAIDTASLESAAEAVDVVQEWYTTKGPYAGTLQLSTPVVAAYKNHPSGHVWSLRYM